MWVQLLRPRYTEMGGTTRHFKAGEWAEVGKKQADYWIQQGVAWSPSTLAIPDGCGLAVPTSCTIHAQIVGHLKVVQADHELPFERTILWDGKLPLNGRLLVGLGLLGKWQIAAPLHSYEELAAQMGSEEDRAKTRAVIHDLRVPVYDTRLMFVRRDTDTERLFSLWEKDGDSRLAFLRALYQVKPLILPLPVAWVKK